MKKLILTALLVAAITPAFAGVKKIGNINGVDIYRVKTGWSLTCPNTTTVVAADPKQPGTFAVINAAAGPGVIPAAANAGGLVGAALVLRPARSETNVNNSGGNSEANSSAAGTGNANTTGGQKVPPGHVNNPSGNH